MGANPNPSQRKAWDPAQRKAWAQKKARERAAVQGHQPLPGYKVAPNKHRCDVGDIDQVLLPGTPIPSNRCSVCGRQWRYSRGSGGAVFVEVTPVTERAPSPTIRSRPPTRMTLQPSGANDELPPEDLVGPSRVEWWQRWLQLRRGRLAA